MKKVTNQKLHGATCSTYISRPEHAQLTTEHESS